MKDEKEDRDETRARVPRSAYRRFRSAAWNNDIFIHDAMVEAMEDWIEKHGGKEKK